MTDREKVIVGLEHCMEGPIGCQKECPYKCDFGCRSMLARDVLALLKAQEPVKPMLKREGWNKYYNNYVCPVCDQELVYEQNYCSECGRAVKWE